MTWIFLKHANLNKFAIKISKAFEQKFTENRLQTPFKIQVGSHIARLRAIGKPNHQVKGNWETKSGKAN